MTPTVTGSPDGVWVQRCQIATGAASGEISETTPLSDSGDHGWSASCGGRVGGA